MYIQICDNANVYKNNLLKSLQILRWPDFKNTNEEIWAQNYLQK